MSSQFAGQKVMSYETCDYYAAGQSSVVTCHGKPGPKTPKSMKLINTKKEVSKLPTYTQEDLIKINNAQDKEVEMLRGANPRYWEDVKEGMN